MGRRTLQAQAQAVAEGVQAEHARRQKHLVRRIQLIHHETDVLLAEAGDRARSVDSKSSFLAVAAGVVIAASASGDWHRLWILAVLPMFFSILALAMAAVALRPGGRQSFTPQILFDRWINSESSAGTAELEILKSKVAAFSAREYVIRSRAKACSIGFIFLLIGVLSLAVVFGFESA